MRAEHVTPILFIWSQIINRRSCDATRELKYLTSKVLLTQSCLRGVTLRLHWPENYCKLLCIALCHEKFPFGWLCLFSLFKWPGFGFDLTVEPPATRSIQNRWSISVDHGGKSSVDHSGTVPSLHPIFILFLAFCDLMQVCQVVPSGSKSQGRVLRAQARYEAFEFATPSRRASLCLILIKKISFHVWKRDGNLLKCWRWEMIQVQSTIYFWLRV